MKSESEMSKQLTELQLLYADVLRKNAQLMATNEQHRKKMSTLQFIEKDEQDKKMRPGYLQKLWH